MELRICKNGQEFLEQYTELMLKKEVLYLLLMANAMADKEIDACPEYFYGVVLANGEPVLLFGNHAPYRLLIYQTAEADIQSAVKLLAAYLETQQITVSGVLASEVLCDAFFKEETKHTYKRGHGMDIMELRQLQEVSLREGRFRQASMEDLELLTKWHQAFRIDCGLTDRLISYEEERGKLTDNISKGLNYVYEDADGELASMAFISRKLHKGVCVSGVYTPPEKRGRGYCASLMYSLARKMLSSGYEYLGLFVDQENPISNHTYKKVGYQIIVDSIEYDRE